MHPDDVAECVADEVERLRARLAAAPDLNVGEPQLVTPFELRVPFTKVGYRRAFVAPLPVRDLLGNLVGYHEVFVRVERFERDLILRSFCDGYDAQPITAELLCGDGSPLPDPEWPRTLPPAREIIIRGHEDYDRPFFCRRGVREYHTHPQHEDNPWDAHRESIRIDDIVLELLQDLQQGRRLG